MEFISPDVTSETIRAIKAGTHKYLGLSQYEPTAEGHYDEPMKLWFKDGKTERYAIFNVLLEQCIDSALAKESERAPYGLIMSGDGSSQDVPVPEGNLQTAQGLQNAMQYTLNRSIMEEVWRLEELVADRSQQPTPLVAAYRQLEQYTTIYNQHLSGWTGNLRPENFLIKGTQTGVDFMTSMVNTIPAAFQDQAFQLSNPGIQVTPELLTETLQNSFARDLPLLSSDMASFRYLRDNTMNKEDLSFRLDKTHLVRQGNSWALAFNDDVLEGRKILLAELRKQHGSLDEKSQALSCPVNHVASPGDEDGIAVPVMKKMAGWFTRTGGQMYKQGFGKLYQNRQ